MASGNTELGHLTARHRIRLLAGKGLQERTTGREAPHGSHFVRRIVRLQFVAILLLALSGSAFAVHPVTVHRAHRRHFRWLRWHPMFRPSHESLIIQNAEIDRLALPRIQDETELEALKADGSLVPIVPGETLRIEHSLDPSRRYCRPWTRDFVEDLSQAYYNRFHEQIQVNSAVRTVEYQRKLRRRNGNAAPEAGDTASSHLGGLTVDISKRGLSRKQHDFIVDYLFNLREEGIIEVAEERRQPVFHIMISDRYTEWREINRPGTEQSGGQ